MGKETLYTAVGRLAKRPEHGGDTEGVILVGGQEYKLFQAELKVWTLLLWQVLTGAELESAFLCSAPKPDQLDQYRAALHRLVQRGLVAKAEGQEVDMNLCFDLISQLYIKPQRHPGLLKLAVLAILTAKGTPIKNTIKMLGAGRDPDTRVLLELASHTNITTAELVRCVDLQIRSVPDEATLVRQIYTDCSVTSADLPHLVRQSDYCDQVTGKVLAAFRAGLILFDKA